MPQVSFKEYVAQARSGASVVSFPTDTVPALAVHPDRADLIYQLKQRSLDKPLILMAARISDLWSYVNGSPLEYQIWQQVAERYLPGALTLVLPASDRVPPTMNPKDSTSIGVRVPDHAIARAILTQTGPLATTSANRSGQPPLLTTAEIEHQFPQVLTLAPAEGLALSPQFQPATATAIASGVPSTVAKWTGAGWEILRQGAVFIDG
ncbi:MAG: L-threonylcarbamoyladenylate synthase [Kovacikia sp.]